MEFDGGPAFPLNVPHWHESLNKEGYQGCDFTMGMSLRDYFAANAMKYMGLPTKVYQTGAIGDNQWTIQDMESFPYELMSKVAYKWADAMLKARGE